jgi:hypothetical protein
MLYSLGQLSCGRDADVLHTVIHFAPAWYAAELERLFQSIQSECPRARFIGTLQMSASVPKPFNSHSGGHLSPTGNRSYAEQLLQHLRSAGTLTERDD